MLPFRPTVSPRRGCHLAVLAAAAVMLAAVPARAAEPAAPPPPPRGTPAPVDGTPPPADGAPPATTVPPPPPPPPAVPTRSEVPLFLSTLLLQTDVVPFRHGATAPALRDALVEPGLYLRRSRIGLEAVGELWRARLYVEAAPRAETADSAEPDGPASEPPGAAPVEPSPGAVDPIAHSLADGHPVRVTEASFSLVPHKGFRVAAGSLRVPLGLSRQLDESDLRLPERARIITRATPDFRVGVAASGDLGLLQYSLGTYAVGPLSSGADSRSNPGGTLYLLRLAGEPVGPMGVAPHLRRRSDPWYGWWRFSTGLSAFHARLPGANESGMGGDAQFQWRAVLITAEVLWTRRSAADRVGFTVEPGIFVVPETLELVTRVEWFNDRVGPTSPLDAWGLTGGATLFSRKRRARAQLAYTWRRPLVGDIGDVGDQRSAGWVVLRATFLL